MIVAERPASVTPPPVQDDPSIVAAYLEDASGTPPGTARGIVRVHSEAEAAAAIRAARDERRAVLPQAARSSVTGGSVPRGETVVSVEAMRDLGPVHDNGASARIRVGPGLRLGELQKRLAAAGWYYPPVPTYQEAMIGGTVATNAGGAASFKYGVTRQWVQGLRVVLFNGDVLCVERDQALARAGQCFDIRLSDGDMLHVEAPDHRLPALKKISAGYHAADPLDLVDLFVGSEGTLGLITEVTLRLVPAPPAVFTGLVVLESREAALALASDLRGRAAAARERGDRNGPDVRAIEWMDRDSLRLLREHGDAARLRVRISETAGSALLFEMESADRIDNAGAQELLARFLDERDTPDGPLSRLFGVLSRHDAIDGLELAFPEDVRRHRSLIDFREAVPIRVSELLAERRRHDPAVAKVGGDLIVPFERLPEMIRIYSDGFVSRGLEHAVWGHLSDGNLHPNAVPRNAAEVRLAEEALFEFADAAVVRGGCPLSEHGVGRSPLKQELLRRFLGDAAIARMRRVKRSLDPEGLFAPGVLFPAEGAGSI